MESVLDVPPWQVVNLSTVERMPAFALNEAMWFLLSSLCIYHSVSFKDPAERRKHVLLFFCAVCTGLANEHIFMYLPLVDNFWHAQATVMLSARFPCYIMAVYSVILYYPSAFVWQFGLKWYLTPFLVGLFACCFYWPFDVAGAKYLWWT